MNGHKFMVIKSKPLINYKEILLFYSKRKHNYKINWNKLKKELQTLEVKTVRLVLNFKKQQKDLKKEN